MPKGETPFTWEDLGVLAFLVGLVIVSFLTGRYLFPNQQETARNCTVTYESCVSFQ